MKDSLIYLRKIDLDYFEKTIGDLLGGFVWKCRPEYF